MAMAASSEKGKAVQMSVPGVESSENGSSSSARNRRRRRRDLRRNNVVNPLGLQPRLQRIPLTPPPTPSPRGLNGLMIRFLFEKQLQKSDVTAAGRIVIHKRVAELHLPPLEAKEGIWMHFDDMDYLKVWTFKFRFWPNNSSRMYIFENTKPFITVLHLKIGDFIMVFFDDYSNTYLVRARRILDDFFFNEEIIRPNEALNGRITIPEVQPQDRSSLYHEDEGSSSMPAFGDLDGEPQFSHLARSTSFESIDFTDMFE